MTNDQKNRTAEMRKQNCSYAKIAQSLSISENTIKTFCRRKRLAKDRVTTTQACKQCGCSIEVKDKVNRDCSAQTNAVQLGGMSTTKTRLKLSTS